MSMGGASTGKKPFCYRISWVFCYNFLRQQYHGFQSLRSVCYE